jgi:hypothetical protein
MKPGKMNGHKKQTLSGVNADGCGNASALARSHCGS